MGKIDAAQEGQRFTSAGDVIEEITVAVVIQEVAADFDRVTADELGVLTIEEDLVGNLVRANQFDAVAKHGAAFELERTRTEGAGLGKAQVSLVKENAASEGVGRGTRELENRAIGNRDAQAGRASGQRIRDLAVPDGLRARATDVEHARVGVVLPVDVVAVDGEDRPVFEVVRERAIVAAGEFVDVGVDGDRIEARETGGRVIIDDDRLGDGQARRIRRENGPVGHEDATEDDVATRDHRAVVVDREGGAVRDPGDLVGVGEAVTADKGSDRQTGGGSRRERDRVAGGRSHGGAGGIGQDAHGGRRSEAERTAFDAHATGEGVGTRKHPDALVRLVDAERQRGGVRQDGRDGIEVGVDAAQLEHALVGRTEGGQRGGRVGVDDVRQGQRTGAASLDTSAAGGASDIDRTGRDFAGTGVGQRDAIAAARITELEPAAGDIGAEGGSRGASGADRGDDKLLITQDGITRVGVGVAQDQRTTALLAEITRTGNDAGDGGVVEAGEEVVADADVAPTRAAEGKRTGSEREINITRGGSSRARRRDEGESRTISDGSNGGSSRDTRTCDRHTHHKPSGGADGDVSGPDGRAALADALADVKLIRGIITRDVGIGQNAGAAHQLADRDAGKVLNASECLGRTADNGGSKTGQQDVGTDFEITTEFDLGQGVARVEREGGTLQEVRSAIGVAPDEVLARPVDDELSAIGGESSETGDRTGLP